MGLRIQKINCHLFVAVLLALVIHTSGCSDSRLDSLPSLQMDPIQLGESSGEENVLDPLLLQAQSSFIGLSVCDRFVRARANSPVAVGSSQQIRILDNVSGPAVVYFDKMENIPAPVNIKNLNRRRINLSAAGTFTYPAPGEGSYWVIIAGIQSSQIWCTFPFNVLVEDTPSLLPPAVWFPREFDFNGPHLSENDSAPNPFLDFRLQVHFRGPSNQIYRVPGFFAGNGEGGGSGNIWRARFTPDEAGQWDYVSYFHTGPNVALFRGLNQGTPSHFNGQTGSFSVSPLDSGAPGFLKQGRLEYVGGHYLKFRDGPYFIKGGSNSPENILAYKGFDNTFDQPGCASTAGLEDNLHRFMPHIPDYGPGGLGSNLDPYFVSEDWVGYDSRGLVGAINYLASKNVNSLFVMPLTLGGDGCDVYPFTAPTNKLNYDLSKLDQWNQIFEHANRQGILIQIVLGETESGNENYLDNGALDVERGLFYREMLARFNHNPAIIWNIQEEYDRVDPVTSLLDIDKLNGFANFIKLFNAYDNPITVHSNAIVWPDHSPSDDLYNELMEVGASNPSIPAWMTSTSVQYNPGFSGEITEDIRQESMAAGKPLPIFMDEQWDGVTSSNANNSRKRVLWDVFFSGGSIEWYFGYASLPLGGDLRVEDYRTREEIWDYTAYAREFMEANLPFWQMNPADHLVSGETDSGASVFGDAEVFRLHNQVYAIYYPDASNTGSIDLTNASGVFTRRWFNPRTGQFAGTPGSLSGGGVRALGSPPNTSFEDWVVLLEK